jgi:hypothetical protein
MVGAVMNLGGDSDSITIVPIAHEFPGHSTNEDEPDWLIVTVDARTSIGSWSARAACLTIREAQWIGKWLRSVVPGHSELAVHDDLAFGTDLEFQGPLLAFKAVGDAGPGMEIRIRVYLSYWLAPPWLESDQASNRCAYFVDALMTEKAILGAANVWDTELSAI